MVRNSFKAAYLDYVLCTNHTYIYWGSHKSLARPSKGCILFDGANISFDTSVTHTHTHTHTHTNYKITVQTTKRNRLQF